MAEIANVNTGETIASEWGDAIRDRTVQRYANAAERATEHPSPNQGDLSFLMDTGQVQVFRAGAGWSNVARQVDTDDLANSAVTGGKIADGTVTGVKAAGAFLQSLEVNGHNQVDGSLSLTTSFANAASVSLSIPAGWASWECVAWGRLRASTVVGTTAETRVVIDGTAGQVDVAPSSGLVTVGARRTGITTTGSRTVTLQARRAGDSASVSLRYLSARAVRTS